MSQFTQFIKERQYLHNVSSNTVRWYTHALKWLPGESPADAELKQMILRMREAGLKPTGCNAALRAINAYLHWASGNTARKCGSGCQHPRVAQLREPQFTLPTFTDKQVKLLIAWKPKFYCEQRLHVLVLLLLDTGCRISEALALRWADVDFDNLLLTFHGKGQKDRIVPFSLELRRSLFIWSKSQREWVFCTTDGGPLGRCVMLRNVKALCRRLGFEPPARTLHACRHTMATNYIRCGGSVAMLQRILGHSTITMTMRYVHLQTADLQQVHQRVTLLSPHSQRIAESPA